MRRGITYFTVLPANLLPMPVPDARIADSLDDGEIHFERIKLLLDAVGRAAGSRKVAKGLC